ncbi:MAG: hypothetical protein JO339_18265, partial [Alphaproteobacteria bacterium]|nr:hypothetical protein [Alphaproteobacteria bacterium]
MGAADVRAAPRQLDFRRIDQLGVAVLRDWLAADPARELSAGEYYLARLARGNLLVENELALVDYCRRNFDAGEDYVVEMGTGFGELSLMLALSGFEATAFESDARRHAGASALLDGLARQGIDIDGMALVFGAFPTALGFGTLDRGGAAIFVSTNVTSSWVMDHIDSVHRALRLFDHLVVDLARFGVERDEQARAELAEAFE